MAPRREGLSHATEAWRLPSLLRDPASPEEELAGSDKHSEGQEVEGAAYVGLYRAPQSDPEADMGFHVCVAIIPGWDEGKSAPGAVSIHEEEEVDPSAISKVCSREME